MRTKLDQIFEFCEEMGASDVHLSPGLAPYFRIRGSLSPIGSFPVLGRKEVVEIAAELLSRMGAKGDVISFLQERGAVDGACSSLFGGRYRFHFFRCQADQPMREDASIPALGIALRLLEGRFRSLRELALPERISDFAALQDGLVIVSGPTGSGKSTTLATLLDQINQSRAGHIITIEDPVEYVHHSALSLVHQRQVGLDTCGFHEALVDALREDPDVILVGEIRERETIRTAITAAETGHLVFTTLHAGDCVGAVERFVSVFETQEQESIRRQLSLVLRGIIAQRLLSCEGKKEVGRRLPACEILVNTPAVANLIATGKSAQIYSAMETGTSLGMQTMEQDLARLCAAGSISVQTAQSYARSPETVRQRLKTLMGKGA